MVSPPIFASLESYGAHLGDTALWRPYAEVALAASGLGEQVMTSGFAGTYPTLVGERLVVKLFGCFPGWRESFEAELAVNRAIGSIAGVPAPRLVASGYLFSGHDEDWPFLIMERLNGRPWRDARLDLEVAGSVAESLGRQIRRVHDDASVALSLDRADWLRTKGQRAAERHQTWGSLPQHLVDQLPHYLSGYRPGRRCMVHGDLTEDHLFINKGELEGIIDWGDAMVTDPFYELGALHLGAFAADRHLLGRFLAGYNWEVDDHFANRALQVALMHEFDLFQSISNLMQFRTLEALAHSLWTPTT